MKRKMYCLILLACILQNLLPLPARGEEWGIPAGGLHILKTNVTGEPLEGAVFQVVRDLKDGELTDPSVDKQMIRIGEEHRIMAEERFWTDRSMSGDRLRQVTTDKQGAAAIYGLSYGTYYLVEVRAPEGYNRITDPIRVSIHKYSHLIEADQVRDDENKLIDNTLHIINVRYSLPDTGNWGTAQLAAAGTGVLFSSAALLLLNRRRW